MRWGRRAEQAYVHWKIVKTLVRMRRKRRRRHVREWRGADEREGMQEDVSTWSSLEMLSSIG
jgi:hypothetical protein